MEIWRKKTMKMYKAIIAGVLSVSMMATTFICAESVDVGFDKVKSFLFGNSEISEAGLDLNADEKVDIVDMIIAKGEFQAKASVEVAQLNYYAEVVADLAQYNLNEWETYKGSMDDCVISDDSDENKFIVNEVNECLSDYTDEKLSWSINIKDGYVTGVVCSLKEYDKKSYESKMLYRAIKNITDELDIIKEMLDNNRKFLKEYIDLKDIYYKNIRSRREAKED